jgi:hypothetical protein
MTISSLTKVFTFVGDGLTKKIPFLVPFTRPVSGYSLKLRPRKSKPSSIENMRVLSRSSFKPLSKRKKFVLGRARLRSSSGLLPATIKSSAYLVVKNSFLSHLMSN